MNNNLIFTWPVISEAGVEHRYIWKYIGLNKADLYNTFLKTNQIRRSCPILITTTAVFRFYDIITQVYDIITQVHDIITQVYDIITQIKWIALGKKAGNLE